MPPTSADKLSDRRGLSAGMEGERRTARWGELRQGDTRGPTGGGERSAVFGAASSSLGQGPPPKRLGRPSTSHSSLTEDGTILGDTEPEDCHSTASRSASIRASLLRRWSTHVLFAEASASVFLEFVTSRLAVLGNGNRSSISGRKIIEGRLMAGLERVSVKHSFEVYTYAARLTWMRLPWCVDLETGCREILQNYICHL